MTDTVGKAGDSPLGFGEYEIVRALRPSESSERYLVRDAVRLSHHVAYRCELPVSCGREQFLNAAAASARLDCPNVLPIEQFAFAGEQAAWIISPYTGDHDGLVLLSDVLADRDRPFDFGEASRAVHQLRVAIDAIHTGCGPQGTFGLRDVHVDRAGRLLIELPGLNLTGIADSPEARRVEVRCLAAIWYELITGIAPGEAPIPPTRLATGLPSAVDRGLMGALDPAAGFETTAEFFQAVEGADSGADRADEPVRPAIARLGFLRRRTGVGRDQSER
ncbi:MAG: hypothetical protein AAFR96_06615 [Planctomycetota bacterium]